MNSSLNNETSIREYLLGRVTEESVLSELEELLFMNEEFANNVAMVEDTLINDYVFGRLDDSDRLGFEKSLHNNTERKLGVDLAVALKEKATVSALAPQKEDFFDAVRAFFKRPQYAAGFAVVIIGIVIFSFVIFSRKTSSGDLAELQAIYKQQRQTETRISGFDYAPMAITRGEDLNDENTKKLRRIEITLIEAVENGQDARAHHDLGIFYLNKRDLPQAIKELDLAVKGDVSNARFHNDLGSAYYETAKAGSNEKKIGSTARAIEEFSRALELNPDLLEALFNKSLTLQELSLTNEARESWNLYLQKDTSSKWADEARKDLEKLDKQQSNLKTKEQVLDDFLAAYRKKDDDLAWKIHCQTRDVFSGVWLPDQLSRRFLAAKLNANEIEQRENIDALTYIGDLEKTRNADFFVADLAGRLANVDEKDATILSAASAAFDRGLKFTIEIDHLKALKEFEESAKAFAAGKDTAGEKMAVYWIVQNLSSLSRFKEGMQKFADLKTYADEKKYRWLSAAADYYAGIMFARQNELTKARLAYDSAYSASVTLGDSLLEQRSGDTIIEMLIETGELPAASRYVFAGADDLYYNSALNTWRNCHSTGSLLLMMKLPAASAEFAAESLSIGINNKIPKWISDSLILAEESRTAANQFDEALTLANRSLALIESRPDDNAKYSEKAGTLVRMGNLKRQLQRFDEAMADYNTAIEFFARVPEFHLDEYAAHRGLLMCLKKLDRGAEMSVELEKVLSLADGYRKQILTDESRQAFFNNEQAAYDIAVEDSLDRGDKIGAFDRAERSRARSLLDLIDREDAIDALQKQVVFIAQPLTLNNIRAQMPQTCQLVEYALLDNRLVAWIISKEKVDMVDLKPDTSELKNAIAEFSRAAKDRNRSAAIGKDLYEKIVRPVSGFLDPAKKLVIIPDKDLYFVPFAALQTSEGRFLIQDFTISYSPSATIFVSASERLSGGSGGSRSDLLSVGDPAFDREEYPGLVDLVAAKTEAQDIAAMVPASKILIGKDATKENLISALGKARILHFAGHYLPNPDSAANSKIILADAPGDSDLKMSEIAGRRFPNLKLVVLSACDTGIEDVLNGEGLVGASRAFLAAGAPVVVASRWNVDSEATENLMVAFHRNWLQKGLDSASSLRQAQIEMIERPESDYASPYFWAAFSVIGGLEN